MSEDGRDGADNPGVIAPPPFIYAGALAAGLLVNWRFRVPFLPRRLARTIGPCADRLRVRRRAPRLSRDAPGRDQRRPLQAGDDRRHRRPLPLHPQPDVRRVHADVRGISALANALSPVLLLPAVFAVMRRGVIEREERYLERKFGDEYLQYKERVRRWI